jgi:hypothetical protein
MENDNSLTLEELFQRIDEEQQSPAQEQPDSFETAAPWLLGSLTLLALILMYALIKYAKRKGVVMNRKWLIFILSTVSLPGYYFLLAKRDSDWIIVFCFSLPLIVYLTYIASDLLDRWITKQKKH